MAQRATAPCRPTVAAIWQLLSQLTFNLTNNCKNQLCLYTELAARTWRKRALWSLAPSSTYDIAWRTEFHLSLFTDNIGLNLHIIQVGRRIPILRSRTFRIHFFAILHASLNKCSRAADTTLSLKANTSRHNTAYKNRLFSLLVYPCCVGQTKKCWIKHVDFNKIHRPTLCQ